MKEVKLDTFKEKVKINHVQVKGLKEFPENIDSYVSHSMKDFIDEKLKKGEKVAILSYTRYEVRKFEEAIRKRYGDKEIQNICPKRARDSTIISNYIKEFKEDLKFLDKKKYAKAILNEICAKIPKIMPRSSDLSKKIAARFVAKWYKQNTQSAQRYANYYLKGQITIDELIEKTSKNLINFEVKNNVIQQSLIAKKNNDEKKIDMNKTDIILSTIHSAKGLEFDNVIVVFKQPSKDLTEADKRMYYVALTRAQKSEYILSYATEDTSLIKDNYDVIIKQLEEK